MDTLVRPSGWPRTWASPTSASSTAPGTCRSSSATPAPSSWQAHVPGAVVLRHRRASPTAPRRCRTCCRRREVVRGGRRRARHRRRRPRGGLRRARRGQRRARLVDVPRLRPRRGRRARRRAARSGARRAARSRAGEAAHARAASPRASGPSWCATSQRCARTSNARATRCSTRARAGRFAGTEPEPRAGLRGGHIPGSLNLPYEELYRPDGTLTPPEALRAAFARRGHRPGPAGRRRRAARGSPPRCSRWGWTCGPADVAVYDGSWTEWGGRRHAGRDHDRARRWP